MLSFKKFLNEALMKAPGAKEGSGIPHMEHGSDLTFDSRNAAHHVLKTLREVAAGTEDITAKMDGSPSIKARVGENGKLSVGYKGSTAPYLSSHEDIDKHYGDRAYIAEPLKAALSHLGKVLPKRPGEYQGDVMHHPGKPPAVENGKVSFQPNTIKYSVPANSAEGKKITRSKFGVAIHTETTSGEPEPITNNSEFRSHPDVHLMSHVVSPEERQVHPEDRKAAEDHLDKAEKLLSQHTYDHTAGHEIHLRTYINHTVRTGETPSVEGFKAHLAAAHDKKIAGVKTDAATASKQAAKDTDMAHSHANKEAFARTFQIHHHVQQATNILADSLSKRAHGGFQHEIAGKQADPEGFVAGGLKVVNRDKFSAGNFARSAELRAPKKD